MVAKSMHARSNGGIRCKLRDLQSGGRKPISTVLNNTEVKAASHNSSTGRVKRAATGSVVKFESSESRFFSLSVFQGSRQSVGSKHLRSRRRLRALRRGG
jgi:hypothetical protein